MIIEEDETFKAAEKYLDERMFWNLLALLNINDEKEKQEILNSSLPDEVMDERFSFIHHSEEECKSQFHPKTLPEVSTEPKQKSPKIRMKPSMKEIFDGSYYRKQKEHAMRSNPSLFTSRSGANSLSMSSSFVEEKTQTIEEEVENIIVSMIV